MREIASLGGEAKARKLKDEDSRDGAVSFDEVLGREIERASTVKRELAAMRARLADWFYQTSEPALTESTAVVP